MHTKITYGGNTCILEETLTLYTITIRAIINSIISFIKLITLIVKNDDLINESKLNAIQKSHLFGQKNIKKELIEVITQFISRQ